MVNGKCHELLQVAVGRRSVLSGVPTAEEWSDLFDYFFSHGLVGLGFVAISKLSKEQRPDMVQWLQWTGQAELIRQQNETANRLSQKVCRILGKHHLHPVILKGQSLAALYDEPHYRKPGDIDVWCIAPRLGGRTSLSDSRERVIKILRPYITPKQARQVVYHHMEFTPIEGTSVEVHFTPSWMFNPIHNHRFQQWAMTINDSLRLYDDNKLSLYDNNEQVRTITTFNLVFVLMHIFRHLFAEGANIRQLTDYYYVLKAYNRKIPLKEDLGGLFKQMGLYKFAGAVGYALREIFDIPESWLIVPPDPRTGKVLLADVMSHSFDHGLDDKRLLRFLYYQKRRMKFYLLFPSEALWSLPFIFCQWIWRKWKGYVD